MHKSIQVLYKEYQAKHKKEGTKNTPSTKTQPIYKIN